MKKKWIAGYLGIFSCLVVVAQQKVPVNLIGKWENIQNKEIRSGLEFTKSDSVFLFLTKKKNSHAGTY
ncbi:MAG: hypothetical protein H0V30_09755 [Chitinophagaceae bacterium]|nr:hypothetical protein [Chitinophagaceae bacterium]